MANEALTIPELEKSSGSQSEAAALSIPELDSPKNNSQTKDADPTFSTDWSKAQRSIQAMATGALSGLTTFNKALAKVEEKILPERTRQQLGLLSAKDYQDQLDQQSSILAQNQQQYPEEHLGLPQFIGSMAPYAAVPSGLALKGAQMAAPAGMFAKLAGSVAGGALEGAGLMGTMTQPGQDPNQILNTQGMKQGAMVGGALGPVSLGVDRFLNRTTQLEDLKNQASQIGYNGPVLARDLPENSWIDAWARRKANKTLDNLPSIFGTAGARQSQVDAFRQSLTNYITNSSQYTYDKSYKSIEGLLQRTKNNLDTEYNNVWSNLATKTQESGLTSIPLNQTKNQVNNLVENYSDIIGKKATNLLKSVPDSMSPDDLIDFKRNVWNTYSTLQRVKNKSPDQQEAAQSLRTLFWDTVNDYKTAVQDKPEILEAFEHANTFTQGYKEIFDPKNNKQLVNAIDSINSDRKGLETWINWMTSTGKSSPTFRKMQATLGVVGNQTGEELGKIQLNNLLEKSTNPDSTLNLATFINGMDDIKNSSSRLLNSDALETMKGVQFLMQRHLLADTEKKLGSAGSALLQGAAVGVPFAVAAGNTAGLGAGTIAMAATPIALSLISRYSPLKNLLIMANKTVDQPNISQYILKSINKQLLKAGILLDNNGKQITIKSKDEGANRG